MNGKKFDDISTVTECSDDSKLLIHNKNGVKTITSKDFKKDLLNCYKQHDAIFNKDGLPFHNCVYRGQNLGDTITNNQSDAIRNGTFHDLYIGDFWVINKTIYRIAALNYFYNSGLEPFKTNHIVLVPDKHVGTAKYNDKDTDGSYTQSKIRLKFMSSATAKIRNDFKSHLLTYKNLLSSVQEMGKFDDPLIWVDSEIELMNEVQVFGCRTCSAHQYDIGICNQQFPLFAMDKGRIQIGINYWLRDMCTKTSAAYVDITGFPGNLLVSFEIGIRPYFIIQ